jgi:glycosyltransferase involved in cell wall biosynthesis
MSAPSIAVLMPVYNPGPELAKSLDSLRIQAEPFRLFLIDDGSKFHTDYEGLTKGMDVRLIRLPKNLGITGALNAGLAEILKGDFKYIARMDNGDFCHKDRFAKQKAYLDAHDDIVLVSSWVRYVYEATGLEIDAKLPSTASECATLLRYNAPVTHTAMMIRTQLFRDIGVYSTEYPAAEDYALEHFAHARGLKFLNLPEPLLITVEMKQNISGLRRAVQLKSRLRLQWRFADWGNIHTYLGMGRTLLLMYAPIGLLRRVKTLLRGK